MIKKKQLEHSIWGFILGDCLGVPYEFREQGSFKLKEFAEYGTHNQPAGTWSDDTSLMLCLIDAFENGEFDIEKHKQNLKDFYFRGKYTVDGVFDIGNSTGEAIASNFIKDCKFEYGNGGLLRCWLLSVLFPNNDELLMNFLKLTHSADAKMLTAFKHYNSLYQNSHFFNKDLEDFIRENKTLAQIEGTIFNALNIVYNSLLKGYGVKEVIEQGKDTDSNAAIFGSIFFLTKEVSMRKRIKIRKHEYLDDIITKFLSNF